VKLSLLLRFLGRAAAVFDAPPIRESLPLAGRPSFGLRATAPQCLLSKRKRLRPFDALRMQKAPGDLVALLSKLRAHRTPGYRGREREQGGRRFDAFPIASQRLVNVIAPRQEMMLGCRDGDCP
jgi:hypothetical protein